MTTLTAAQRLARTITERAWQAQAERLLATFGWRSYHAPDNAPMRGRDGRMHVQNVRGGWPDLFAIKAGRAVALELKKETGVLDAAQRDWLLELAGAGVEVDVLRPSEIGRLEAIARGALHLAPLDLGRLA